MSVARDYQKQMIHYLRKSIDYTMDGTAYVKVGVIPAGAVMIRPISGIQVGTAFNAAGSNTVNIGTPGNTDLYATLLSAGAATFVPLDEAAGLGPVASDTTIVAEVVLTGTAATAGAAEVVIAYLPDNDG